MGIPCKKYFLLENDTISVILEEKKGGTMKRESWAGHSIRFVERSGEWWAVAQDVCKALEIGNPSMALERLDSDEKMTLSSTESHSGQRGGAQQYSIINEPGLYSLVLGSM